MGYAYIVHINSIFSHTNPVEPKVLGYYWSPKNIPKEYAYTPSAPVQYMCSSAASIHVYASRKDKEKVKRVLIKEGNINGN